MLTAAIMFFCFKTLYLGEKVQNKNRDEESPLFSFYKICISRFTETYFAFLTSPVCVQLLKNLYIIFNN